MDEIRRELLASLRGGQAYDALESILGEIPADRRNEIPRGLQHSAWEILEHMRRTLEDLLAYSTNFDGGYRELNWPGDYWPAAPGTGGDWDLSLSGLFEAQARMEALVSKEDLTAPFPWEPSHCLLREALLAVEHAAYHAGELVQLSRVLDGDRRANREG